MAVLQLITQKQYIDTTLKLNSYFLKLMLIWAGLC